MMQRPAYEIELGHLAESINDLLAREMDNVFQDLLHEIGTDRHAPARIRAETANRIVVLCRKLTDQIRRYERLRCGENVDHSIVDDIPF